MIRINQIEKIKEVESSVNYAETLLIVRRQKVRNIMDYYKKWYKNKLLQCKIETEKIKIAKRRIKTIKQERGIL